MDKDFERINVTKPFLPPLEEFESYLKEIWRTGQLTNNGPFHEKLENALCEYLGVRYISLFSNGTLALITALQALQITGEVITTPFSFVATAHSLWWNGIKPVFVDIEPDFCNIDPDKIAAAITPHTTAILAVHVYGNPCNITKIQKIADAYGLKVLYDAAHAFGVKMNDHSILNFGDLSIMSFHATKVFNTFEGGAIVCHDENMKKQIDFLKNFGFADELTVVAPGINAKMNEFQAALGLLQLKFIDSAIGKRKLITEKYRECLQEIKGLSFLQDAPDTRANYSYFPILINPDEFKHSRDELYEMLKKNLIFTRRYFYPLISQLPSYNELDSASQKNLPVANQIANKVLCLPIYPDLELTKVEEISKLIRSPFF
jgi:dTDP-4-amino-4,6-dideoxy-D-glucose transaminase